jgi:hypothetical protein
VLSAQAGTEELRDFAEMVGTELVVIDEATTIPALRDHLRWSAAYHRLGGWSLSRAARPSVGEGVAAQVVGRD